MKRKSLLLTLLMALFAPWAANAQKALPYSYGFENNDLDAEGWTVQKTSSSTGIFTSAKHEGSYGFQFYYSEQNAYLVSPVLSGTESGVALSFYYKEYSSSYGDEQFYVGYTTDETVTDPSSFTYGDITTASLSWELYEVTLPAGTKKVAIKYVYNDAFYLYIDDFTFEAPATCAKPTNLAFTLTPGNGTIADLSWTENGEATAWQICLNGDETNLIAATTNPWQLTNLTPETTYTAKVRANCGSEQSDWSNEVTFTPTNAYSITVNDGTSTNSYVPYYAYYHDSPQRSEFIIPASSLEDMTWGTITSMKFYPNYTYTTSASIQVYLMEVEATTFSDVTFYTEDDATVVYNGTLTISPNGLIINLNGDGFEYNGGNLLVGFYQATGGSGYYNSTSCPFYGVTAEGASIEYYYSTDYAAQKNFLPKTTFEYTPGEQPTCFKPKGLVVDNITINSAKLAWEPGADETKWQICLNDDETNLILVNENSYTLTNLTPDTDYTVKVRAYCGADDQSSWTANVPFTTEIACPVPTNVTVSDVTATSATISWTGDASSYNLRYRVMTDEDYATITFAPDDVWQDGTGYQLLLDADATAYGTIIPESGGLTTGGDASAAVYAEFEYKFPANADGAMNTQNVLIGESATIRVPAGTFDWCVTNPTPGDRIWIAGEGRADDYVLEGGKTYLFVVQSNGDGGDEVIVTVSDTRSANAVVWTEVNDVTSPYTITVDSEKDYVVEVQANCVDYLSSWVRTTFSTPSNCPVPTPLDVTDVTAYTATLNWTGLQDSYEVQYRTKGSRELLFFEDFDGQPSTWTLTNATYNRTSSQTTDYFVFLGSGSTEAAYMITPELTGFENGGTLEFMHRAYNGTPTFQVGFSTTTNDVDAFTWGSEVAAATGLFGAYSVALPNGTKYVAITTTTETSDCCVLINDFGIYGNEIPAGEWNTATADTTSCPISGLAANTEYEWQVRGVCTEGYSDWSELHTFTTDVSCHVPTGLTVSDVTGVSAVATWTSDASSFDIDVNGVVTEGVTNPYTLEDLEPATIYTVKVRANCGDGDYSEWSTSWRFVTDCGGAKDLPYTYGFEDLGEFYGCWGTYAEDGNNNNLGITGYDGAYDGSNVFMFSSYNNYNTDYDQYLFSPELNAEGEVALEFYYRTPNGYGSETFKVGYSADGSEYTWGDEVATNTTEWTAYNDTLPAGTKFVAIHYYSNYQYYLLVDGFKFEEATGGSQTIELKEGYNWVSFYVEGDPVEMLGALQESLNEHGLTIEGTAGINYNLGDGYWWGDLDEIGITSTEMYLIEVDEDCTIELPGVPSDPSTTGVTIEYGYNWISFPNSEEVEVNTALEGFEAGEEDMIEGPDGMIYHLGDGYWWGDFETFVPGQGYLYYYSGSETQTLYFQTGAKKVRSANLNVVSPIVKKVHNTNLNLVLPSAKNVRTANVKRAFLNDQHK